MSLVNPPTMAPFHLTVQYETVSSEFQVPATAATLAGFLQWASSDSFPEHGQVYFVHGKLWIDMSPELFETHNFLKTEITSVLYSMVKREKLGLFFSDRSLFANEAANISTEPDAMFVTRDNIDSTRSQLIESKTSPGLNTVLQGSPNWVLEIVSPSSRKKANETLRENYFLAGIDEYWLIDALSEKIDFQLLTRGEKEYAAAAPDAEGWLASPTFKKCFRLERNQDEGGFWQYTLHVQESMNLQ